MLSPPFSPLVHSVLQLFSFFRGSLTQISLNKGVQQLLVVLPLVASIIIFIREKVKSSIIKGMMLLDHIRTFATDIIFYRCLTAGRRLYIDREIMYMHSLFITNSIL